MLVSRQINTYITNNEPQICADIVQRQFPKQTILVGLARVEDVRGQTYDLVQLKKADDHVEFVLQNVDFTGHGAVVLGLTHSIVSTCLHIFEGLHYFHINTDDELESTVFVIMLQSILPWLRLISIILAEALREHSVLLEIQPLIEMFRTNGAELACENVMVKHGLGPVVHVLGMKKALYPPKEGGPVHVDFTRAQIEFLTEGCKWMETENMMWSWAQYREIQWPPLFTAARPDGGTRSATWGSVVNDSLALKYLGGEVMGLNEAEPMKEGFRGFMMRCDAFPARVEVAPREPGPWPTLTIPGMAAFTAELECTDRALEYNWAGFVSRGVKYELANLDKQLDRGSKLFSTTLRRLVYAKGIRSMGFEQLATHVDNLPPHAVFLTIRPTWITQMNAIETMEMVAEMGIS